MAGLLENIFFSGAIFGWSALFYILKQEGVYGHLCDQSLVSEVTNLNPNSSFMEYVNDSAKKVYATGKEDEVSDGHLFIYLSFVSFICEWTRKNGIINKLG